MRGTLLAEINIWVDAIGISAVTLTVLGLTGHFFGNVLTGRFKKRFFKKDWGHHGEPEDDFPFINRFLHLLHAISMVGLIVTGISIRFPFIVGARTFMRYSHYVFLSVITFTLIGRFYTAFFGERYLREEVIGPPQPVRKGDYKEFSMKMADIKNMFNVVLYYAFVRPSYPHIAKYNPLQKSMYGYMFPAMMVLQAYTGFALLWPHTLLFWASGFAGGAEAAAIYARLVHATIMWLFFIFVTIHAYMATMEDFPILQFMFVQRLPRYVLGHEAPELETASAETAAKAEVTVEDLARTSRELIMKLFERELQVALIVKNYDHATWVRQEMARLAKETGAKVGKSSQSET